MIKFFRHIRKDLMEKNKTGKYFKYAIGEIVLVVIGILIALSINNWNEERKTDIVLANSTKSMINDLKNDIEYYDRNILRLDTIFSQYAVVFDAISQKKSDNVRESVGDLLKYTDFRPNNASYKTALSNGILGNHKDFIEIQIVDYYEKSYKALNALTIEQMEFVKKFTDLAINEFPNFSLSTISEKEFNIKVLDILKTDRMFNRLIYNRGETHKLLKRFKETKQDGQQLIKTLESQLNK